jgi:hypothetical protein
MNARQMTRIAAWIALAFLAAGGTATAAEPQSTSRGGLFLARQGKPDCVITLPAAPSPVEQTAARELGEYLYQVTGAKLDVRSERDVPAGTPQIVVGQSARAQQLLPGLDVAALGPDAIVIKSVGNRLVLCGRPPRGTLYAVYTLLEDVVGCRWWTSHESYVPKKPTLEIPPQDMVYAPPLWYREAYYRDAFDGLLAARLKLNGNSVRVAPEYGGHYRFAGFVHTFYPLLPPAKYFAAHPEWYSEIQGKRTADQAQLCVTNDEMRKQLTRNVLQRLRSDPGVGLARCCGWSMPWRPTSSGSFPRCWWRRWPTSTPGSRRFTCGRATTWSCGCVRSSVPSSSRWTGRRTKNSAATSKVGAAWPRTSSSGTTSPISPITSCRTRTCGYWPPISASL